jgi:hypothetical protein
MAGNIKLVAGTHTAATTSGSSLTSGSAVAAANALANSTNLEECCSARLTGAFGSSPTEGGILSLYLVPKLDGSNVADFDVSGTPPIGYWVGNFYVAKASTSTQRLDIDNIPLMPFDYLAYLVNSSGQTLSSGWLLDFWGAQHQYT